METISNIQNKYVFAQESEYGVIPGSFTQLDIGYVQTISVNEDDNVEEVSAVNSGHTLATLDDDLYNLSGSITTKLSQASVPVLLKGLFGKVDDDVPSSGKFTATTDPVHSDDLSYFMKFNTSTGKIMNMVGLCFTGGDMSIAKDGSIELTLNYQAKKLTPATETLSPVTPVGKLFRGLDAKVTYNGHDTNLDSFDLSLDWNFTEDDSRGIEEVGSGERRVIQRVIRNGLTLTGSFDSVMDENIDTGYLDERSNVPIVVTLKRGDYEHIFTISTARTSTRSRDLSTDNSHKVLSCDFIGTNVSCVGSLFFDSSP